MKVIDEKVKRLLAEVVGLVAIESKVDGDVWDRASVVLFEMIKGEYDIDPEVVEKANMYDNLCK